VRTNRDLAIDDVINNPNLILKGVANMQTGSIESKVEKLDPL
jgi:hypothetical protein